MKCLACLTESAGKGVYPYDDDKLDNTEPTPRLSCIEAQPREPGDFKLLILCFDCWHRLEGDSGPDMWTSQDAYEALDPRTPFAELPRLVYTRPDGSIGEYVKGAVPVWSPEHYLKTE